MSTFQYQQYAQHFAQLAPGMGELAQAEFQQLGATNCKQAYRGMHFSGNHEVLYRINYMSRLATRILAPLITFDCHSTKYLYKTARQINWHDLLNVRGSFAVFAQVSNSQIRHSQYAALKLKDAIVDHFRDRSGKRPNVDTRDPDIWFNLHIENNRAVISLDTSGGSLHKRGYRKSGLDAPMQETLAAAIVLLTNWNGEQPFIDNMCGSGTLLAEAHMQSCGIPPAYLRERFGFERLPDFDPALWRKVRKECNSDIRTHEQSAIFGSDVHPGAIAASRNNLNVQVMDYQQRKIDAPSIIVCNPPYGIRLGKGTDLASFYRQLGDYLKQRCSGSKAFIYFGDRKNMKFIGLRPSWKKALMNGGLDGRLALYELY